MNVPNVPCGVERIEKRLKELPHALFLMHCVELKEQ